MNIAKYLYENFNQLKDKEIKNYLKSIFQEIENHKTEIFAPSPWHAWAFAMRLDFRFKDMNNPSFIIPAYRGQSNADQPPIPSIYRPDTNREFEQHCLDIFSFLFNQEFLWQGISEYMPLNSSKATAQHYGIKTDLLDITANPAVAIYFSCHSNNEKNIKNPAIFVYNLSAIDPSVNFILPPPIVERLYLQQGAFLSFPENDIQKIQEKIIKIYFPYDPQFKVIMNGENKDIICSDKWFINAIEWAKKWVESGKTLPNKKSDIDKLLINTFEKIGYPDIFKKYNDPALVLAHWIDNFEDMLYWYGMRIKNNREGLLLSVRNQIARNNPQFIRLVIDIYDALQTNKNHDSRTKKMLRDTWKEALKLTHQE